MSQLKLETLIKDEVAEFSGGLNEVCCKLTVTLLLKYHGITELTLKHITFGDHLINSQNLFF